MKMQRHIMLFWESKLIHKMRGKTFVPFLHFVGDEKTDDGKMFHVMVMDLLGKSLEDLFQECRRKFDLKTVCHISSQMVSTYFHRHDYYNCAFLCCRFKESRKFTRKELSTVT